MGACNIDFEIEGPATWSQIEKKFNDVREENQKYNGHQDGYSGDFQTVHKVKDHTHMVFNSHNEAYDYCLDKAQKWDFVVAVRYRDTSAAKPSAKLKKLQKQWRDLENSLRDLNSQLTTKIEIKLKSQEFITCGNCKSRMDTRFRNRTLKCPICDNSFLTKTDLKKRQTLTDKIEKKKEEIQNEKKKIAEKFSSKAKIKTLVAGWGAC